MQLFADEEVGPDHLAFKLPAGGGNISLFDATGGLIQTVSYGAQAEGVSQGRYPDGDANIATFAGTASPGAANYIATYTGPVINEVLAQNTVCQCWRAKSLILSNSIIPAPAASAWPA